MPEKTARSQRIATPPPEIQATTPPSGDYSYTVELVARIENQLGKVTEAIESLKLDVRQHSADLKSIGNDVHGTKVAVKVAAWLIGIFLTILTLGWTIAWAIINRPNPPIPH